MSGKSNRARYSQSRTDTRIGAAMRVDGDLSFTGVLHVQGAVRGDVSCDADGSGTIVVDQSGSVAGTLRAPHVVVGGKVSGPSYSSESIEIQPGAALLGDIFYREIEVQAGGIVEGSLTPGYSMDRDRLSHESPVQDSGPPAAEERDPAHTHAAATGIGPLVRSWGGRALGGAIVALIAGLTVVLMNQAPTPNTPPGADVVLKADSSMKTAPVAPATPAGFPGPQADPGNPGGVDVRPATGAATDKENSIQAPTPDLPEIDPARVIAVHGVNPGKPAGVLSVISEGPSILLKRKRQDASDGARIDVPNGASTIAIAKNEIFRVVESRNIVIFYQGRKVGPKTIEAGAWMSFVPQSQGGARDKE